MSCEQDSTDDSFTVPTVGPNHSTNLGLSRRSERAQCHAEARAPCEAGRDEVAATYRWARVDGEEQPRFGQLVIELHPRHCGLDDDVHTVRHVPS